LVESQTFMNQKSSISIYSTGGEGGKELAVRVNGLWDWDGES